MPDISCLDEGEHSSALPLLPLRCGRNAPAAAARGRQGWTSWEGKVACDREGKVACARASSHDPKHPKIRPKIAKTEKLSWPCTATSGRVPARARPSAHLCQAQAPLTGTWDAWLLHTPCCVARFSLASAGGFTGFLSRSRNLG